MQFPHLFSSRRNSTARLGLQEKSRRDHDQESHKNAFRKNYLPRIEKRNNNNNKTVGGKNYKFTTTKTPWKLETEITQRDSQVEQHDINNSMTACVAAPQQPAKSLTTGSRDERAGGAREGGGGVFGKLLLLTKKNSSRRIPQQSSRAATAAALSTTTPSPFSVAAPRHDSVTARTCFSSSICSNFTSLQYHPSDFFDHHSTWMRPSSPPDASSRQRQQQQRQPSTLSSDALAAISCIQQEEEEDEEQQQGEFDSSLHSLTNTVASGEALTTFQLQKHEYNELGYMQFQYSMDDDGDNDASSSSSSSCVMEEARTKASLAQKPLLAVHAVVPNGDVDAGLDIFSHPLVVEAAQSLFVTVFCKTKLEQQQPKCRTRVSFWHHQQSPDNDDNASSSSSEQNPSDLVPCLHGDTLTLSGVVSGMIQALQALHATFSQSSSSSSSSSLPPSFTIPKYLLLLQEETNALPRTRPCVTSSSLSPSLSSSSSSLCGNRSQTKTAVFGMDDSHLGEVEFAGCTGVLATRAGHCHAPTEQPKQQQHVVQVSYDSRLLSYCSLVRYALQRRVGQIIYYQTNDERVAATMECDRIRSSATVRKLESSLSSSDVLDNSTCDLDHSEGSHSSRNKGMTMTTKRTLPFSCIVPDFDPKRALRKTPLKYVPLTSLQATRANRLVHYGRFDEAVHLLSPQQGLILLQRAMRTSTNKDMHEMVDIPIAHAWLCVCEQVHPKLKETNDIKKHNNDSSSEEDTNEWGGRCYE